MSILHTRIHVDLPRYWNLSLLRCLLVRYLGSWGVAGLCQCGVVVKRWAVYYNTYCKGWSCCAIAMYSNISVLHHLLLRRIILSESTLLYTLTAMYVATHYTAHQQIMPTQAVLPLSVCAYTTSITLEAWWQVVCSDALNSKCWSVICQWVLV